MKLKMRTISLIITLIMLFLIIDITSSSWITIKQSIDSTSFIKMPENLRIGDLLFIESIAFFHNIRDSWDHVAIYIGNSMFVEANNYTTLPPPFKGKAGVQITPLLKYKFWTQYYAFGKVNANESQRLAAVNWALSLVDIGGYQVSWGEGSWWANPDPNDENDPNSNNFYCAELVWAAYYNTSNGVIDLDISPGPLLPPRGDGIHLAVSPKAIARCENVSMYTEEGAPSAPTKPKGDPTNVTIPQFGTYSTTSTNNQTRGMFYQWVWGDYYRPSRWVFIPGCLANVITAKHLWHRINIHDRFDKNYAFDVRVRCKDKFGRISNWSNPLPVDVTPNFVEGNWISPTGYVDSSSWNYKEKTYDNKPYLTSSIYRKINDNEWCDEPLILTLDNPTMIKGFRIRTNKGIFHDKMEIKFYNGTNLVKTCTFTSWPHLRWKNVDFHRYEYKMDKVEIHFHMKNSLFRLGFFAHPIYVYEFYFQQI